MLTRNAIEFSAGSHGSAGFKIACKNMIRSNLKMSFDARLAVAIFGTNFISNL